MPRARIAGWICLVVALATPAPSLVVRNALAQKSGAPEEGLITPEVATRSDDYAAARHSFRTKLRFQGPAPESDTMPPTPEGVTVVTYSSGALRLTAWMGRPQSSTPGRRPAVLFLHGGFSFGPHDWTMTAAFRDSG